MALFSHPSTGLRANGTGDENVDKFPFIMSSSKHGNYFFISSSRPYTDSSLSWLTMA
jgi:hypothetical protein